jgi:glycosyltransferase involved in cell wall biosynthesis
MADLVTDRAGLGILASSITPYNINLYRGILAEIPELQLHLLVSHGADDFKWKLDVPLEIRVTHFGTAGEDVYDNPLRHPLRDWRKGGRFIRYLQEQNIRAVVCSSYRFISHLRLMSYCHKARVPFFVHSDSNIRNEPPLSPPAKFVKRALYAWWTKRAAGVFSMGKLGDQFFVKYGADPDRIYRVPLWPDFETIQRIDTIGLERFRRQFGLDQQRRRVMFSGRFVPLKRLDLLIDAFAAIAADRPNWDLMLVGDGALRDELRLRVPPSLQSRVIWTGFLDGQDLALAYQSADVLVLPSDHEQWSLVIQEAMAAGLVVVSSDVPGATYELVDDGRSGRVFPKGNFEQLTQALRDTTSDAAFPNYKRESAAAWAKWRNNVDPVAEIRRALVEAGVLNPALPSAKKTSALSPTMGQTV